MDFDLKKMGYLMKLARTTKLKMSQEDFAAEVDLHRTYIGSIERGDRDPGTRTLMRICNRLGLSLDSLAAECTIKSKVAA